MSGSALPRARGSSAGSGLLETGRPLRGFVLTRDVFDPRRAPVGSRFGSPGALAALLCAACLVGAPCAAQPVIGADAAVVGAARILVVDLTKALRESRIGAKLQERETQARAGLQAKFDAVQRELEARERELLALRQETPKQEFDAMAQAFDARVRTERQDAQEQGAALRARFERAGEALARRAGQLLSEIAQGRGAELVLRKEHVLFASQFLDATADLTQRINGALSDAEIEAALEGAAQP